MPVGRPTPPLTPADAIDALIAGPTSAEADRGLASPFAGLSASVSIVADGLYVNFAGDPGGLRQAGDMAHEVLARTVFEFDDVRTLSVTLNGSCTLWREATASACNAEAPGRTPPPDAPTECRGEPGDPASDRAQGTHEAGFACTESPNPD